MLIHIVLFFTTFIFNVQAYKAMATSGPASVSSNISTRSIYGPRARTQRERQHFPVIDPNFDESDMESDCNEDELVNIDEDGLAEESGSYSDESDADVDAGDNNKLKHIKAWLETNLHKF